MFFELFSTPFLAFEPATVGLLATLGPAGAIAAGILSAIGLGGKFGGGGGGPSWEEISPFGHRVDPLTGQIVPSDPNTGLTQGAIEEIFDPSIIPEGQGGVLDPTTNTWMFGEQPYIDPQTGLPHWVVDIAAEQGGLTASGEVAPWFSDILMQMSNAGQLAPWLAEQWAAIAQEPLEQAPPPAEQAPPEGGQQVEEPMQEQLPETGKPGFRAEVTDDVLIEEAAKVGIDKAAAAGIIAEMGAGTLISMINQAKQFGGAVKFETTVTATPPETPQPRPIEPALPPRGTRADSGRGPRTGMENVYRRVDIPPTPTPTPVPSPIPTELEPTPLPPVDVPPPSGAEVSQKPQFNLGDLLGALPQGRGGGGLSFPSIGFPVVGTGQMLQSLFPLPPGLAQVIAPPHIGAFFR